MNPYFLPVTDITPRNTGAEALTELHRRTVDVLAGYDTMVEKAEPSFRSVAESFRALHERHAERLARMIADKGEAPDAEGTMMGTINKTVVSLRALFDDIDADVMDNIRDGEKHVLEAFDDALGAAEQPEETRALSAMRDEIVELVASTAHLD